MSDQIPIVHDAPLAAEDLRRLRAASPTGRVTVHVRVKWDWLLWCQPETIGPAFARTVTGFRSGFLVAQHRLVDRQSDDLVFEVEGDPAIYLAHEPEIVTWELAEALRQFGSTGAYPLYVHLMQNRWVELSMRPGFAAVPLVAAWLRAALKLVHDTDGLAEAMSAITHMLTLADQW